MVVQGPTASGKTGLAIRIGERFSGEIVNADSLQMLRGFTIGSAKPTSEERARAPHHLIDAVDADEALDAGRYVRLAREVVAGIHGRGKLPIVAGGTGLYVRALLGGLADLPGRDENLRESYRRRIEREGLDALFESLEARTPGAERYIDRRNSRRVIRALEILDLTGKPIWDWQKEHGFADRPYRAFRIAIRIDMETLRRLIDVRTRKMLEDGFVDEVRGLVTRHPDRSLKPYESIGYRQVLEFLDGKLAEEDLAHAIIRHTRRYAKRQLTWLKREEGLRWIEEAGEEAELFEEIERFLS